MKTKKKIGSHVLRGKWSKSRGRATYGYNVFTLSEEGQRVSQVMGGGYDMTGRAIGEWLQNAYPSQLIDLAKSHKVKIWDADKQVFVRPPNNKSGSKACEFDGLTAKRQGGEIVAISIDGACGVESVSRILEAIGLELTEDNGNWSRKSGRRKNDVIYFVSPPAE